MSCAAGMERAETVVGDMVLEGGLQGSGRLCGGNVVLRQWEFGIFEEEMLETGIFRCFCAEISQIATGTEEYPRLSTRPVTV